MKKNHIAPPSEQESPAETGEKKRSAKPRRRHAIRSAAAVIIIAAALAVLLSSLFLPVIQISGSSMEPALHDGDILVLWRSKHYDAGQLCCISWQNKLLIKRVIATGGETVDMDDSGNVFINGTMLDEPYLTEKSLGECDISFPYTVPQNRLFMLGDNRESSIDSRSSVIGCITDEQIIGRVLFRVWPL